MRGETRETYALAAGTAAVNLELIAWGVVLVLFLDGLFIVLFGGAPRILLNFMFGALVMHGALRTMLSGGAVGGLAGALRPDGTVPWPFLFRALLLSMPSIFGLLMVGGLLVENVGRDVALFAGVIVGLTIQAGVLAMLGTMLTDLAQGGSGDAGEAMARSEGRFLPVFVLMLTGPTAAELAVFAVERTADGLGLPDRIAAAGAAHLSPLGLVVDGLLLIGSAAVSILTAAVLIQAWRAVPR